MTTTLLVGASFWIGNLWIIVAQRVLLEFCIFLYFSSLKHFMGHSAISAKNAFLVIPLV